MTSKKSPAQDIEQLYATGWAALQAVMLIEAEQAFLGVLANDPEHADALNGLGTVYFHLKRLDEAEAMYEKGKKSALKFFDGKMPDHADWSAPHDRTLIRSLHGLALVTYRRGKTANAEKLFNDLLKLNPEDNTGARFMAMDIRKGKKTWDQKT
jgi:Flp pilus assembly protein TadD